MAIDSLGFPVRRPSAEKPFPWDGLFSWAPTMDVFAVSGTNEVVCMRLLSWERVWRVSTADWGGTVTSFAWRPDGRGLAVGCSDGSVRLLDLETSDVLFKFKVQDSDSMDIDAPGGAVVSMSWQEDKRAAANPSSVLFRGSGDFLGSLPALAPLSHQRVSSTVFKSESTTFMPTESEDSATGLKMNLLVVATASGALHSRVYGTLPIGQGRLGMAVVGCDAQSPAMLADRFLQALSRRVDVSSDLAFVWVTSEYEIGDGKPGRSVVLDVAPTGLDAAKKTELLAVADKTETLNNLLRYIDSVVKIAAEEHGKMADTTNGYWKKFDEVLYDHGASTNPTKELKHLMATGKRTESIELFLTQHVGDRGIRIWEKAVEQASSSIKTHVVEFLRPACERLYAALSELASIAGWKRTFGRLKIDVSDIRKLSDLCSRMLFACQTLALALEQSSMGLLQLIRWLKTGKLALRIAQQRFMVLCPSVLDDTVEQREGSREVCDSNAVSSYLDNFLQSDDVARLLDESDEDSLVQIARGLQEHVAAAFSPSNRNQNGMTTVVGTCTILDESVPAGAGPRRNAWAASFTDKNDMLVATMGSTDEPTRATMFRISLRPKSAPALAVEQASISVQALESNMPWKGTTDCSGFWFYGSAMMCLALRNRDGDREQDELLACASVDNAAFEPLPPASIGTGTPLFQLAAANATPESVLDIRFAVKDCGSATLQPNPSRGLLGIVSVERQAFCFLDVEDWEDDGAESM
ncbi:anaphase-promoting complex, cyclosome, subunit 4-domain-containing protein [Hyaloraphidium curvatum]|nr:anaphase-promoting complex, cyclosome, subunit 4-domain-containing protein [Hyaloraphidium curvatum]